MPSRTFYILAALIIFIIEVLIALFVHDAIIRPFSGDVLVVILVYCTVRIFYRKSVLRTATAVLLFACLIEGLQYARFIQWIGFHHNKFANVVLGNTFSPWDLLCYVIGFVLILITEKRLASHEP